MASSIGSQAPDASAISHKRAEICREQAEKRDVRPYGLFVALPARVRRITIPIAAGSDRWRPV
jgi:hypothetical protein